MGQKSHTWAPLKWTYGNAATTKNAEVPVQYHRNVVDRHRFDVNPDLDPTPSFTHVGKSVPVPVFFYFYSQHSQFTLFHLSRQSYRCIISNILDTTVRNLDIFGKSIRYFIFGSRQAKMVTTKRSFP